MDFGRNVLSTKTCFLALTPIFRGGSFSAAEVFPRRRCPRRKRPRRKCPRRKFFRGGGSSAADDGVMKDFSGGHFFQRTTPPVRGGVRPDPRGFGRSPPVSAGRSADVRRSPLEIFFGGRSADPRGTGRSPRGSARFRADPRRKVFRRPSSLKFSL